MLLPGNVGETLLLVANLDSCLVLFIATAANAANVANVATVASVSSYCCLLLLIAAVDCF